MFINGSGGGAGSGQTLISETVVGSSVATVDFDTVFDSTYDRYKIEVIGILPVTGDAELYARLRTDSYQNTLYEYRTETVSAGTGSSDVANSASGDAFRVLGADAANFGLNDAATGGGYLDLIVALPANATKYTQVWGIGHAQNEPSGGGLERAIWTRAWGQWKSATAVTGIRFLFNTGNIAAGTFRVWGMPNS
jgi:hypothetical protein